MSNDSKRVNGHLDWTNWTHRFRGKRTSLIQVELRIRCGLSRPRSLLLVVREWKGKVYEKKGQVESNKRWTEIEGRTAFSPSISSCLHTARDWEWQLLVNGRRQSDRRRNKKLFHDLVLCFCFVVITTTMSWVEYRDNPRFLQVPNPNALHQGRRRRRGDRSEKLQLGCTEGKAWKGRRESAEESEEENGPNSWLTRCCVVVLSWLAVELLALEGLAGSSACGGRFVPGSFVGKSRVAESENQKTSFCSRGRLGAFIVVAQQQQQRLRLSYNLCLVWCVPGGGWITRDSALEWVSSWDAAAQFVVHGARTRVEVYLRSIIIGSRIGWTLRTWYKLWALSLILLSGRHIGREREPQIKREGIEWAANNKRGMEEEEDQRIEWPGERGN